MHEVEGGDRLVAAAPTRPETILPGPPADAFEPTDLLGGEASPLPQHLIVRAPVIGDRLAARGLGERGDRHTSPALARLVLGPVDSFVFSPLLHVASSV